MDRPEENKGAKNQASLRNENLALVSRALWAAGGGLSRADLSAKTGLTRATVSRLVTELIEGKLLIEGGPLESGQPGRPGTPLRPATATVAALGIEVNVDHSAVRAIDLAGTVLGEDVVVHHLSDTDPAFELARIGSQAVDLVEWISAGIPDLKVCGASVSFPGLVSENKMIRWAPNLGWRDVVAADLLGKRFQALNVPVFVDNDANLQGLASSRLGPGRMVDDPSFFFVGGDFGTGAAIIRDGIVRRGNFGWSGEIGHITVDPDGPECACGAQGCLEKYASHSAIYQAAGLSEDADSSELLARLEAGDPATVAAVERAGRALGMTVAGALSLLDIRKVVLGSDLADVAQWLNPVLSAGIERYLMWSGLEKVVIESAIPDQLPAATGGAYLMLERVIADPADWLAGQSS